MGELAASDVTSAAQASSSLTIHRSSDVAWTQGHEAKRNFNVQKQFDKLVDSVLNGAFDSKDLPTEWLELVVLEAQRRREQRIRSFKRPTALRRTVALKPRNLRVFVDPAVISKIGGDLIARTCRLQSCRLAARERANLFVVPGPVKLGQRTTWACGLSGGLACEAEYFMSDGQQGLAVAHGDYGASKRMIHTTAAFRTSFPNLLPLMEGCAERWRFVDEDVVRRVKNTFSGPRANGLFVLVCAGEWPLHVRNPLFSNFKIVLTEEMARTLILQPDPSRSQLNVNNVRDP